MSRGGRRPKKAVKRKKEDRAPTAEYRVLVHQPLSMETDEEVISLKIQSVECGIAARAVYADESDRRAAGGMVLSVEFEADEGIDLLDAARDGYEL